MAFIDEYGNAIITPKTRTTYQTPEQKSITAKVESIAPTTTASSTTTTRRSNRTRGGIKRGKTTTTVDSPPVLVTQTAPIIYGAGPPVPVKTPIVAGSVDDVPLTREENIMAWADRQSGGAPSISGGGPVGVAPGGTYDKIPSEIKTGTGPKPKDFSLPYYTLITSKVSATPEVIEKAGQRADEVTGFATKVGVAGFVTGTTVAAVGPAAAVVSTKAGLGATAAGCFEWSALLGASTLAPTIAKETHKASTFFTSPSDFEKMSDPMFMKSVEYAKGKYAEDLGEVSIDNAFQHIGSWIPGIKQIQQSGAMDKYVTEFYIGKGFSELDASHMGHLSLERNWAEGIGDVSGTVGIETSSELLGRSIGGKLFTKFGGTEASRITKTALLSLPIAGFVEGSAEYTKERIMENQEIKVWDTCDIGPVTLPSGFVGSGLFGSVFATAIGTPIARWSVTRPPSSKTLLTVARIIDPYEITGDYLAPVLTSGKLKGVFGFTPPAMNLSPDTAMNNIIKENTFGPSSGVPIYEPGPVVDITGLTSSPASSPTNGKSITPSFTPSDTPNIANVPSYVPVISPSFTPNIIPSPITDIIPDDNITDIIDDTTDNTITDIIDDTISEESTVNVPTDVPTNIPTSISTALAVPIDVWSAVPTATPLLRLPIYPLHGGGGRGMRGGVGGFSMKGYSFKEYKIPSLKQILGDIKI